MEGGGFRALAADAGLVAGLLAAVGRSTGDPNPTLASTGLLDRFGLISSVSGSSWFAAELVYSGRFLALVEGMGASPATAAAHMQADWMTPWLVATDVDPVKFRLVADLVRLLVLVLLGSGDEDTIFMLQYFLTTGKTWNDYVDLLLNSTAGLGGDLRLGADVNAWARGKVWMVDHTIILPTDGFRAQFYEGLLLSVPSAGYVAESSGLPSFLPARFSVRLGAGVNSSAPVPYVAPAVALGVQQLTYKGVVVPIIDQSTAFSGPLGSDLARGNLERYAGLLPVARAVAASSAFVGCAAVAGPFVTVQGLLHVDVTPWVSAAPAGKAFAVANELIGALEQPFGISAGSIAAVAEQAVRGVIDGGFSDGTGISQAVAAGADEILVVLNSNATNDPFYVEVLFAGGPKPATPGEPAVLFPVFSSPQASEVRQSFRGFQRLELAAGTRYLQVLAIGTIRATTAENRFFGIAAGRSITIHVVNICSDLNIGEFESLNNYNVLAQEVALTIADTANAARVQRLLLPAVLGRERAAAVAAAAAPRAGPIFVQ